jgi:hypothetical protein
MQMNEFDQIEVLETFFSRYFYRVLPFLVKQITESTNSN